MVIGHLSSTWGLVDGWDGGLVVVGWWLVVGWWVDPSLPPTTFSTLSSAYCPLLLTPPIFSMYQHITIYPCNSSQDQDYGPEAILLEIRI